MQTRSSPSRHTLHRLAEQASIPEYQHMSKKLLYENLKQQFDLKRLQRAEQRRRNKKTNKYFFHESNDEEEPERARGGRGRGGRGRGRAREGEEEVEEEEEEIEEENEITMKSKKRKAMETSSSNKAQKKMRPSRKSKCDNMDPIMRTPLGKNVFTFVRPNGSFARFNVESLVDYMLETGDFTDPASRLSFSDDDLKMIDQLSSDAKLNKESVFAAKKNNTQLYADKHFRRDALQGLERCAGEIISEMLQLIEHADPEEAQMKLLMTEFPAFADLYQQMKEADPVFARQCNRSWLLYLQGPPNRPTKDPYGLLQVILHFVKGCENSDRTGLLEIIGAYDQPDFDDETDSLLENE